MHIGPTPRPLEKFQHYMFRWAVFCSLCFLVLASLSMFISWAAFRSHNTLEIHPVLLGLSFITVFLATMAAFAAVQCTLKALFGRNKYRVWKGNDFVVS